VFHYLQAPAQVVASPDVPSPVSSNLERLFYPGVDEIVSTVIEVVSGRPTVASASHPNQPIDEDFHGPF